MKLFSLANSRKTPTGNSIERRDKLGTGGFTNEIIFISKVPKDPNGFTIERRDKLISRGFSNEIIFISKVPKDPNGCTIERRDKLVSRGFTNENRKPISLVNPRVSNLSRRSIVILHN